MKMRQKQEMERKKRISKAHKASATMKVTDSGSNSLWPMQNADRQERAFREEKVMMRDEKKQNQQNSDVHGALQKQDRGHTQPKVTKCVWSAREFTAKAEVKPAHIPNSKEPCYHYEAPGKDLCCRSRTWRRPPDARNQQDASQ
jgi:hypothetical protein